MVPSFSGMNVLLAKVQAALGTKQTDLASTDFRTVDEGFTVDYKTDFVEQNLAQGFFGQPQRIKGMQMVDVVVSMPIIPTGSSTVPNVDDFFNACGMSYVLATAKHTYAPSSALATDWKDMTVWAYTGDKATGDSLLTKAHSCMFDFEITAECGQPWKITFTGKGVPDGAPAAASFVSGTLTPLSGAVPAMLKATTMEIGGIDYSVLKFSVKMGNTVELIKSPADDSGYAQATITGRKSTWTATVYQEDLSAKNPFTNLAAQTLGSFSVTSGAAGSRITVAADTNKAEIIEVKSGNEAGLNTFELSGTFIDNGWSIAINDA